VKIYRPAEAVLPGAAADQPSILLYTLWRSGTHWLAEMLADLTGLTGIYASDDVTDYARETASQLQQYRRNTILIRHLCTAPQVLLALTDSLDMRVILLYRDPRDVLASNVNMRKYREGYRANLPPFPDMSIDAILDWELEHLGDIYRRLLPAWVAAEHPALLKVRYEDLLTDTRAELRRVANFVGRSPPEERIAEIARTHDFQRKTARQPGEEDKRSHQRRGVIGDHRRQFSAEQLRRIAEALGDAVRALGYAT